MSRKSHLQIGIASVIFAVFLALLGIRYGVSSPSNVGNIILSPLFWPYVVAAMIGLAGIGLILTARMIEDVPSEPQPEGGWIRLAAMAVLMLAYVLLSPLIGLVWTSMLAFAAVAFLVRTHHPVSALIAAVLVPLALYAFFAHVAGVNIPQGEFVRLP